LASVLRGLPAGRCDGPRYDQSVLPLTGLYSPNSVAVDAAGNVYVIDNSGFGQVVRLAAG
jgi:hypothetical protein